MRPSLRSLLVAVTVAACASGLVTATALASPLGGLLGPSGSAGHAAGHSPATAATLPARPTGSDDGYRQVSAVFSSNGDTARTYDVQAVPVGSKVTVTSSSAGRQTVVTLEVSRLLPGHGYGAHAHTKACGATGAEAGPHFQHEQDPHQPSTDPAYANDRNEIWLDLTTDAAGAGVASTRVAWQFPQNRRAQSVVLHDHHTSTAPGSAGEAGTRLACVNVGF